MSKKLFQTLAQTAGAYNRCAASGIAEWERKHLEKIENMVMEYMPHGNGIDHGVEIDLEKSGDEKLVFTFSFHHMDENGYYDSWTDHTAIVVPSFNGFRLKITGRNRSQIKDYLHELFSETLNTTIE